MFPRIGIALALVLAAGSAAAQGVDRYEFLQMKKDLDALQQDVGRLRGVIASGAASGGLEDEIRRLTGEMERLGHQQRQLESKLDQKLLDLEYRVIELEGGDPSVLFDKTDPAPDPAPAPAPAPSTPAPAASGGATVGTLAGSAAPTERAAYEAGVASYREGRAEEARRRLETFLTDYPGGALAPEAHYWLGETLFRLGDYRGAASRFLDASTLNPSAPTAPEAMLRLGQTFLRMNQQQDGCLTLKEVRLQFPSAGDQINRADAEARRAGCGG